MPQLTEITLFIFGQPLSSVLCSFEDRKAGVEALVNRSSTIPWHDRSCATFTASGLGCVVSLESLDDQRHRAELGIAVMSPEEIGREWLLDLKPLCRELVIGDEMEPTNKNLWERIRSEVNTRTITCQGARLLDLPLDKSDQVRQWVRQEADLNLNMPAPYIAFRY